ncbi:MAG: HD domain-containing phosphohydrolase [Pyrinomonadaceae bacterium]
MSQIQAPKNAFIYQTAVTVTGLCLWALATVLLAVQYSHREQLVVLAIVPLVVIVGMFPTSIVLPYGLKFTKEKITFTLTDAFILLVACSYGVIPAIVVGGIEGLTSSIRAVRRPSSNLFSSSMFSLAAAMGGCALHAVLRYGFAEQPVGHVYPFRAATVALLVGSVVQVIVNWGLLSTLLALRYGNPILREWKEKLVWAVPMFLPTGTAATLLYLALHYDGLVMALIGGPILIAIYFGHRRYGESIQERISVMEKGHRETIEALAVAINAKDKVTHEHVLRVQIYAAGVARLLKCNEGEIEALKAGALLHDIGKIAVPDHILNKPGKLTADEFEKMKLHTTVGAQILGRVGFPFPVVPVVRHHHERWDGKGYPDGLSGDKIPLTARILSVVDCFDAVREDRQYRKAMTREQAIDFIMSGSGTMYDPQVVGTFITHLPEFEAEILAHRNVGAAPTYGIEPLEQLSEAARLVAPAAGLAVTAPVQERRDLSHQELQLFYDLTQEMGNARDHSHVINAFLERLPAMVPFNSCAITLPALESGKYVVAHASGQRAELMKGREIAVGEGATGWALANRRSFCNADPRLDLPPALAESFADYRTLVVFPIIKGESLFGVVTLYSSDLAAYTPEHERLLEEASRLLAHALSVPSEAFGAFPTEGVLKQTEPALHSELAH